MASPANETLPSVRQHYYSVKGNRLTPTSSVAPLAMLPSSLAPILELLLDAARPEVLIRTSIIEQLEWEQSLAQGSDADLERRFKLTTLKVDDLIHVRRMGCSGMQSPASRDLIGRSAGQKCPHASKKINIIVPYVTYTTKEKRRLKEADLHIVQPSTEMLRALNTAPMRDLSLLAAHFLIRSGKASEENLENRGSREWAAAEAFAMCLAGRRAELPPYYDVPETIKAYLHGAKSDASQQRWQDESIATSGAAAGADAFGWRRHLQYLNEYVMDAPQVPAAAL